MEMYCKFCGSRIASNTTKCASCGANIDFNDGGQSFFEDNELDAWQSDNIVKGLQTSMPKTEMSECLPLNDAEHEKIFAATRVKTNVGTIGTRSRTRKKKKTVFDYLNLSSSNRLIIFCIASALAVVLLATAIIAVLNSGDNSITDEKTYDTSYTEQVGSNDDMQASDKEQATEDNVKTEIKDIKIIIDNKEILHPVSAYIIDEKLYVSLDRVLKAEGYKTGVTTDYNENCIRYDHETSNKTIEIEKGTASILVIGEDEAPEDVEWQQLEATNFNEGAETYVPAKSFFATIGYSNVKYDMENVTLIVEK
jgi:hypothetical protein